MSEWIPVSERLPVIPENSYELFNVAVKRGHNGKTYVFSACYLNALLLLTDDEDCPEDGVPVTGWYMERSDDPDYDTSWNKVESEGDILTDWRPLPEPPKG